LPRRTGHKPVEFAWKRPDEGSTERREDRTSSPHEVLLKVTKEASPSGSQSASPLDVASTRFDAIEEACIRASREGARKSMAGACRRLEPVVQDLDGSGTKAHHHHQPEVSLRNRHRGA